MIYPCLLITAWPQSHEPGNQAAMLFNKTTRPGRDGLESDPRYHPAWPLRRPTRPTVPQLGGRLAAPI